MVLAMSTIHHILTCASAFAEARGVSEARVSTLVFNHGARIKLLREGADLRMRSADAAMQWFSDHWPEGVDWPAGVPRPDPSGAGVQNPLPKARPRKQPPAEAA